MKIFKTSILFGGLIALAASVNAGSALVTVTVPFDFVAGGTAMPAGSYIIEEPSLHGVLLLRGNQPNSTALVLATNAGPSATNHAGLTFSRKGGAVVLSTVEVPGGITYSLVQPEKQTAAAVNVALPRK